MAEFLFLTQIAPFTLALALVSGMCFLEIVSLMLGGSILAIGDGVEADLDAEFDLDVEIDADADVDGAQLGETDATAGGFSISGYLGLGTVPLMIWIAAFLTGFGLIGFIIQSLLQSTVNWLLPVYIAVPVAALLGLRFARGFGYLFARLIPKSESSATAKRFLGSRHGIVTQGTARRGSPAEVRVKDRHGNMHYLRAEPMDDGTEIPQGTEVYVTSGRQGKFRLLPVDAD